MALLSPEEWRVAEAIAGIGFVNPFLPERVELERLALGPRYREEGPFIRARSGEGSEELFGNVPAIWERAESIVSTFRRRIEEGHSATRDEIFVYENIILLLLYLRYMNSLDGLVVKALKHSDWNDEVPFWPEFRADFEDLVRLPGHQLPSGHDPAVIFAGLYQIERAFTQIYRRIRGGSLPAARLRAAVWQSIFTRDMGRYIRVLHRVMVDVPTLIVGPSGSGKELVARAIGLSGFIPFDPETKRFDMGSSERFVPLNLSALAPTLVESELFGHKKGAFTGALADRDGWLKSVSACGAVFLDEIGELDLAIQVKLLRVLETRTFQRLGDTVSLKFQGKILAATNRDLGDEMRAGRFRHDLYYRLCADQVVTPSLAEQLADCPEDLPELVHFIVKDVLAGRDAPRNESDEAESESDAAEVERLSAEVVDWINRTLRRDYAWPGNFRELGQCVRNVMIRGSYRPSSASSSRKEAADSGPVEAFLDQIREAKLTHDEILGRYDALVFHRSGENYAAAGQTLGVDWRVVKRRLDPTYLDQLRRFANAP